MEGFTREQLPGALEAMLFVTDEPVTVLTFADMLQVDPAQVEEALDDLREQYRAQNRGSQRQEGAGGWRLATHPQYHELIEEYVLSWDTRKLSQAALETLAIVAYCQPITRQGISSVRGVSSDSSVNSLVEKGLLREAGTADVPGNPVLYATTRTFLEKFGLRSVADLPELESFAPDEETRTLIAERLSPFAARDVESEFALETSLSPTEGNLNRDGLTDAGIASNEGTAAGAGAATGAGAAVGEGIAAGAGEGAPSALQQKMQAMLDDALRSSVGVVDKINFDELEFDEDD